MKTSNDLSHPALEETLEHKPQHQDAPRTPLKESSQKRKKITIKTTIISTQECNILTNHNLPVPRICTRMSTTFSIL
jgi:hypothetical protein